MSNKLLGVDADGPLGSRPGRAGMRSGSRHFIVTSLIGRLTNIRCIVCVTLGPGLAFTRASTPSVAKASVVASD